MLSICILCTLAFSVLLVVQESSDEEVNNIKYDYFGYYVTGFQKYR
jgi:hypothetical protein